MQPEVKVLAMEENVLLLSHAWENQSAHVVRTNGKLRRCMIGKLTITQDSEVAIWVRFRELSKSKDKIVWAQNTVSPLHLLYANDLWVRSQICSESETETDGCQARDYDVQCPNVSALPPFVHEDLASLSKQQRRKLAWMTKQNRVSVVVLFFFSKKASFFFEKKECEQKKTPSLSFNFFERNSRLSLQKKKCVCICVVGRVSVYRSDTMSHRTERPVDETRMSKVTSGSWNGHAAIFKRNHCGEIISSQALSNEIIIMRHLSELLQSKNDQVRPIMNMLSSSMTRNKKGHALLELVQEQGAMDMFNYCKMLEKTKRFAFTQRLMRRVLDIVIAIHECNVAHNDIKPENMVIRDIASPVESMSFIDFGFACIVDPNVETHVHSGNGLWLDNKEFGTGCYRHPNLMERKQTNMFSSDLYACGMVCFTILTDSSPYEEDDTFSEIALRIHKSFLDGTWKHKMAIPKHILKHPKIQDWVSFIDMLCGGKQTIVTQELQHHRFLSIA